MVLAPAYFAGARTRCISPRWHFQPSPTRRFACAAPSVGLCFTATNNSDSIHSRSTQSRSSNANSSKCLVIIGISFKTPDQQAYDAYQAKQYPQAASQFKDQAWKGAALYQAGNYQAAIQELQGLTDEDARYNLANAQAQAGLLEQAKQGYQDILKTNPTHADAKRT